MNNQQRDEQSRIAELKSIGLLDSLPEERFDRLTRFCRRIFQTTYATVSFVDEHREWFKSAQGTLPNEIERSRSPIGEVIRLGRPVVIQDISRDPRFSQWCEDTAIKFYAAHPIYSPQGFCLGAVTVADVVPRTFSVDDAAQLSDMAALVEDEVHLHSIANIDDLTQLFNRRGFLGVGEQTIAMCQRMQKPATMMFMDLDGFKAVNDNYGHAEGDKVLKTMGDLMSSTFRHSDVVARLGGDEFCVLLSGTDTNQVERPLANLQDSVEKQNQQTPYDIDFSVGVVPFSKSHSDIKHLLDEADQLMYRDKYSKKARSRS